MKRGELFKINKGTKSDPKKRRVYLIVSRQDLVDNNFPTVMCAPVFSKYDGYRTQVEVGVEEGLKHDSAVYCDNLASIFKSELTDYVGSLSPVKMEEVNTALRVVLDIE